MAQGLSEAGWKGLVWARGWEGSSRTPTAWLGTNPLPPTLGRTSEGW